MRNQILSKAKNLKSSKNYNGIFISPDQTKNQRILYNKLKEENRHLKEEHEKYKIRTNYLIKSAKQMNKVQFK